MKGKDFEKNLKNFPKSIDKESMDVIYSLSCPREGGSDWTLKIKQRDKKRNPRFRWFKDHQKSFKKYFSNSNTEAKIAKY